MNLCPDLLFQYYVVLKFFKGLKTFSAFEIMNYSGLFYFGANGSFPWFTLFSKEISPSLGSVMLPGALLRETLCILRRTDIYLY